ncbi:gamma-glutamyl-gamma-aminobutyrate hydrolase family protein [Clostridiaceae bacterium UIB06]|uniref:Gamma-glutamyl-gamma-aminobutyrate hydrolase family protein n=1 Tax=Clostridium thailandense TaxID=2794346 RepID=A0A949WSH2_9CLOT|nr:gamma-glutamyl-gamma-aminobutyrate hydrolase family protein [Clostridium thailandense]MBV7275180.1 gamma-glutamyl-gamma-aminobutyrate hydrolase family protein [Clostridium thailandense]MCH5137848.1 gamma-glutamyl-gamma-aminobutyrate hydrolase family protein [Clostridiaceae bacterium UIB06]
MNKPLIGIIGNLLIDQGGMFPGYERAYVNNDYVQSVAMAGGIPFILPLITDYETIKKQIETVDALIISGGYDVNPLIYGEEPIEQQGFLCPERDEYDIKVIKIALELKKPILGVCRGLQILNAALGGTLHQDTSMIEESYIKHHQSSRPDVSSHTVNVVKGTKLYDILGEKVFTNSFHHQAIKELASGFKISAKAKDGVIEAIEKEEGFIIGVQWHPEMMASKDSKMLDLFKELIKQCNKEEK